MGNQRRVREEEAERTPRKSCPLARVRSAVEADVRIRTVMFLPTGEVLVPELRLEQEPRHRFEEYAACHPDQMHVHLLRDGDFSAHQQLIV